jgi:hypothetical protein
MELSKSIPGLTGIFVVSNKSEQASVRRIYPDADVKIISDHIEKNWSKGSTEVLREYEKKYFCEPIWNLIYTDRFLIRYPFIDVIKYVCGMFSFYKSIFENRDIDFYFDETIATAQSYIAYYVAKHYGAKYLALMAARGFETTHHYVVTDPFQHQFGFNQNYKEKEYNSEVRKMAEKLYEKYQNNYSKPSSMVFVNSKPKFNIKLLARFARQFVNAENHNKYDLINYKCYNQSLNQFCFFFRYLLCKRYYSNSFPKQKFIYFPLHYQPEASTLVCATKYEKQIYFIDSWAKSIPADTLLVVKEHYALVGHRKLDFYRALRQYPNVVMLTPWTSSIELIKHAEAVTTLTGTAGWEAMILGKPVYLGGKIFFDNAPGIYDTSEAYGVYDEKKCGANRDEIIQYLCEYVANIFPGVVYFTIEKYTKMDNIKLIAISIYNAICIISSNCL